MSMEMASLTWWWRTGARMAAASCRHNVGVLLGNGDGTFATAWCTLRAGFMPTAIAVADVNGDGNPDLVVANCGSSSISNCVSTSGNGNWQCCWVTATEPSRRRSLTPWVDMGHLGGGSGCKRRRQARSDRSDGL